MDILLWRAGCEDKFPRLVAGSDGQIIICDSTSPLGFRFADPSVLSDIDADDITLGTLDDARLSASLQSQYTVDFAIDFLVGAAYLGDALPAGFKYFLEEVQIISKVCNAVVTGAPHVSVGSSGTAVNTFINDFSCDTLTAAFKRDLLSTFLADTALAAADVPKVTVGTAATGPTVFTGIARAIFSRIPL